MSGASLGAAAGAILAGPSADRFGHKTLLIADAGIHATGAIMSAVTPDAAALLFARTLVGLAIGADSAIATAYLAEYAPKNRRGSLAMAAKRVPRSAPTWWSSSARTWASRLPRHTASRHRTQAG